MQQLLDILRDIPGFLETFIQSHGAWVYALLFGIVFFETGFVVTPFLPGDSLLFAVGALAGAGALKLSIAAPLLVVAAICGNTSNYWIGRWTGPRVFRGQSTTWLGRLLSRKHLDTAHRFYERHGGKAVMLGQFLPIIRTFVPYVAGAGAMNYRRFILFNVMGALAWVGVCCGAGYLFGGLEFVKKNFELVIIAIILISVLPMAYEWWKSRREVKPA